MLLKWYWKVTHVKQNTDVINEITILILMLGIKNRLLWIQKGYWYTLLDMVHLNETCSNSCT